MLNVVYNGQSDFFIGFSAELSIPGSGKGSQQMLVDTGSSAVAFCDKSLANGLKPATCPKKSTDSIIVYPPHVTFTPPCSGAPLLSGNAYGTGDEFYWGYMYNGDLLFDSDGISERLFKDVSFSVMEKQEQMTCTLGFDGIWGVAFINAGTNAWIQTNADSNPEQVLCLASPGSTPPGLCDSFRKSDWCTTDPVFTATVVGQALQEADVRRFGLYLDVDSADWASVVTEPGMMANKGKAYVGAAALSNSHYTANSPQVVPIAGLGDNMWSLSVLEINVKGKKDRTFSAEGESPEIFCGQGNNCFFDSGTPQFVVSDCVMEAIKEAETGSVEIVIAGEKDQPVKLTFPVDLLLEMKRKQLVATAGATCDPQNYQLVIGFPAFFFYYVVFNYGQSDGMIGVQKGASMTFVEKQ
eukprot:TRINITY_DN7338_c0_g2_i1.p1 TRINITY_DN7338_c0_g2~~TRINITY_DN7338_c0_g2_i1.p1  ORF type:complete len:411 (-),score=67.63 TRINITY_DN7338_c0_g2_i1:244-1476(-)